MGNLEGGFDSVSGGLVPLPDLEASAALLRRPSLGKRRRLTHPLCSRLFQTVTFYFSTE